MHREKHLIKKMSHNEWTGEMCTFSFRAFKSSEYEQLDTIFILHTRVDILIFRSSMGRVVLVAAVRNIRIDADGIKKG